MKNKLAFLFDGQGSFTPGVGKNIYDEYEVVRNLFDRFNAVIEKETGEKLEEYCFGKNALKTRGNNMWVQLAITAVNLGYAHILDSLNIMPDISLGHSLGEISALIYSGGVSFDDGIRLVKKRGEIMNSGARNFPGDMMVIGNLPLEQLRAELENFHAGGDTSVGVANINEPGQITVSGTLEGLKAFREYIILKNPQTRVKVLNIGGAWHSTLLKEVSREFREFLESIDFRTPERSFFSVTRGRVLTDPGVIKESLAEQLVSEVNWLGAIDFLRDECYTHFLEVGPGRILYGLLMKISKEFQCRPVCRVKNFYELVDFLQ